MTNIRLDVKGNVKYPFKSPRFFMSAYMTHLASIFKMADGTLVQQLGSFSFHELDVICTILTQLCLLDNTSKSLLVVILDVNPVWWGRIASERDQCQEQVAVPGIIKNRNIRRYTPKSFSTDVPLNCLNMFCFSCN